MNSRTRRDFLHTSTLAAAAASLSSCGKNATMDEPEPFQGIVDIHQHAGYLART
ncbi:MAG: twin-arginine translocation signal domain-containing protein, partial [bacterium]|nr:twin-arginine translocation signal domain-containing protein [bacterium]